MPLADTFPDATIAITPRPKKTRNSATACGMGSGRVIGEHAAQGLQGRRIAHELEQAIALGIGRVLRFAPGAAECGVFC